MIVGMMDQPIKTATARQTGDEKQDGAGDLGFRPEAVSQKFVNGRAVKLIEGGDKQKGDDDPGQKGADKKLGVFPVFHIRDGGNRDQGYGADLRGHKRQTGRPPRDPSRAQEKVIGGLFFSARVNADKKQQHQKSQQNRIILPGETAAG